MKAQPKVWLC